MELNKNSFWENKNVLITGHTGFKGVWLSSWLNYYGANLCGIGLKPEISPNLFNQIHLEKIIKNSHISDICNFKKTQKIINEFNPEIVFHLAAQPLVLESYKNPLKTWETNLMGTANILNALHGLKSDCSLIVITTDKVYENKEWIYGYRETDRLGGHDPYSASKAATEILVNSWRKSFCHLNSNKRLKIATTRAGNVIGGGDWSNYRLIPDVIKALIKNNKLNLRNPKSTRPWQHVLEPLCGYILLAQKITESEQNNNYIFESAFNFGPEENSNKSVELVVNKILSKWGKSLFIKNEKNIYHEANLLSLDINKSKSLLNWKPLLNFEETIDKTLNWYYNVLIKKEDSYENCIRDIIFYINKIKI